MQIQKSASAPPPPTAHSWSVSSGFDFIKEPAPALVTEGLHKTGVPPTVFDSAPP